MDTSTQKPLFNSHDFECVAWKQKWKNGKNEFHYPLTDVEPIIRHFSEDAVMFVVDRVVGDAEYLANLRAEYRGSK